MTVTMDLASREVTGLLSQVAKGDRDAEAKLIPLVYAELHRMARGYMRREREEHTLQPTALVHEAYFKLVEQHSVDWRSRTHFFGVAAQVMRRVLMTTLADTCAQNEEAGKKPFRWRKL